MQMTDYLLLALFQIPALALAAALAYLARRTRTLGSYVMLFGALISLVVSVAANFVPRTKTPLFDSSGNARGVMVSAGHIGPWLTSSRVAAALLLALGAVLLAREWRRPCCHPGRPAMRLITTMCALLAIVPGVCLADGFFRCGSWLVSTDTSVADLLKKCGKPSSEEVSTQDVENKYGAKVGTSTTQVWRYDRDSRPGPLIVTIVDGRVQRMKRGK